MKIKKEHYEHMKQAIKNSPVTIKEHRSNLLRIGAQPEPKNFDMRLRWDMFMLANLGKWGTDTLYPYLNDTHIDTALKAIIKELEK